MPRPITVVLHQLYQNLTSKRDTARMSNPVLRHLLELIQSIVPRGGTRAVKVSTSDPEATIPVPLNKTGYFMSL
jgi:hypothetical protein